MLTHKIDLKKSDEFIQSHINHISFDLEIEGKPNTYSRERAGRGSHFYNPKSKQMKEFREKSKKILEKNKDFIKMQELVADENAFYYVEFIITSHIPIPKADSKLTRSRKDSGLLKPTQRPDLDNYEKFVFDSLHEVFYNDDCRITKSIKEKKFSNEPRTSLKVDVYYYEAEEDEI